MQTKKTYIPIESKEFKGWFEIPGFSRYCANKEGHVLNKKTKNFSIGGRSDRYLRVSAYKDGQSHAGLYYIHDLVCRAFHGLPEGKNIVVMHKDNNRSNNRPSNLQWGTQSENILQVYRDGLKFSHKYSIAHESYPSWMGWALEAHHEKTKEEEPTYYVSVNSSLIKTADYNSKDKTLDIEFRTGGTYRYHEISAPRFRGFIHAKSQGKYFLKHIKGVFPAQRL